MVFYQWVILTAGDLETRLRLCLLANNEMYSEIVYHSLLFAYLPTVQGHLNYVDHVRSIRPELVRQLAVEHPTIVSNHTA